MIPEKMLNCFVFGAVPCRWLSGSFFVLAVAACRRNSWKQVSGYLHGQLRIYSFIADVLAPMQSRHKNIENMRCEYTVFKGQESIWYVKLTYLAFVLERDFVYLVVSNIIKCTCFLRMWETVWPLAPRQRRASTYFLRRLAIKPQELRTDPAQAWYLCPKWECTNIALYLHKVECSTLPR